MIVFLRISESEWLDFLAPNGLLVDLKSILPRELGAMRL